MFHKQILFCHSSCLASSKLYYLFISENEMHVIRIIAFHSMAINLIFKMDFSVEFYVFSASTPSLQSPTETDYGNKSTATATKVKLSDQGKEEEKVGSLTHQYWTFEMLISNVLFYRNHISRSKRRTSV